MRPLAQGGRPRRNRPTDYRYNTPDTTDHRYILYSQYRLTPIEHITYTFTVPSGAVRHSTGNVRRGRDNQHASARIDRTAVIVGRELKQVLHSHPAVPPTPDMLLLLVACIRSALYPVSALVGYAPTAHRLKLAQDDPR